MPSDPFEGKDTSLFKKLAEQLRSTYLTQEFTPASQIVDLVE